MPYIETSKRKPIPSALRALDGGATFCLRSERLLPEHLSGEVMCVCVVGHHVRQSLTRKHRLCWRLS